MTGDFEARLLDDATTWQTNTVRLAIRRNRGLAADYLMPDGTWTSVEEGDVVVGIELPRGAIEAIAEAIAEWQGHTSHADTEARVLREWLAVERDRVDAALASR
jgi:hypothetical protein